MLMRVRISKWACAFSGLSYSGVLSSGLLFSGVFIAAAVGCSSDESGAGGNGAGANGGVLFGDDPGDDFGLAGTDGSGFDSNLTCVGQTAGAESAPAVLQLVVDTSGSMNQGAPGTNDSKWIVTRRALLDAIDEMPGDTSVGVVFYPDGSTGPGQCFDNDADIGIARLDAAGSPQRSQIRRAFQNQSPEGGTPTHDAYQYAFGELQGTDAIGSRYVVVITDGTPTFSLGCVGTGMISDPVDSGPLVVEAASIAASGVNTFVIGSPGSEGARRNLSRMAEAGGTAAPGCSHDGPKYCHFDMTEEQDFATALGEALGTISGLALSCNYDIPMPPNGSMLDPERVNVLFSPSPGEQELILKNAGGPCNDGWQYSQDQSQILLCGSTCDRVRASDGSLTLQFGCTTEVR